MKKILSHSLLIASAGLLIQQIAVRAATPEVRTEEQVIRILASTFEFKPSEITVKKGVPVIFELISMDRHHGFKLSKFDMRADIKPGAVEKVRFVPDKTGTFTFFCDVFCGDGHE